jgi:hypothetical protein
VNWRQGYTIQEMTLIEKILGKAFHLPQVKPGGDCSGQNGRAKYEGSAQVLVK